MADVEGSEDEENLAIQWETLVHNSGGAGLEDGGSSEGAIVISDPTEPLLVLGRGLRIVTGD